MLNEIVRFKTTLNVAVDHSQMRVSYRKV